MEGKGYRVAFPLSEILPLAQWKQEVGPSREEAIRNHSPSQHGLPTICYLLHFTIKQNTGRTKEDIKNPERVQSVQGRDTRNAPSCCNPAMEALHIHLNFKYRA